MARNNLDKMPVGGILPSLRAVHPRKGNVMGKHEKSRLSHQEFFRLCEILKGWGNEFTEDRTSGELAAEVARKFNLSASANAVRQALAAVGLDSRKGAGGSASVNQQMRAVLARLDRLERELGIAGPSGT